MHGEDKASLTVTEYTNFSVDTVPVKSIRCLPNKQPRVIKDLLNEKKEAFKSGDRAAVKKIQRQHLTY